MNETLTRVDAERSFAENEHRELSAGIADIETVAWSVGWTSTESLVTGMRRVVNWIATVLTPHVAWEEAVVYPEVDRAAGTEWATRLMRYEHHQIAEVATRIERDRTLFEGPMTHESSCQIRGDLVALATLLRAHIERESRFLLPILAGRAAVDGAAAG